MVLNPLNHFISYQIIIKQLYFHFDNLRGGGVGSAYQKNYL